MEFQTIYNALLGIATAIIGFMSGIMLRWMKQSLDDNRQAIASVDKRTQHIETMIIQDYLKGSDFKEFRAELLNALGEMRADIKADNLRLQNQIQSKADK